MIIELLAEGISNGFYWFPFVLGVGFLYKYLKVIDVSIDGIATFSIIAFVSIWNATHSLALSVPIAILSSMVLYSIFSILVYELRINAVFAGIIFSLVLYALSVIAIGESVSLDTEGYYPIFKQITKAIPIVSLILSLGIFLFYKTKFGVAIRVVGENIKANTRYKRRLLLFACFLLSGFLVGYGAVGYALREHVARSGGGFDFLINAMTSFLLVDRIIDYIVGRYKRQAKPEVAERRYSIISTYQNPIVKALIGSVLLQILIIIIIAYTPNPIYWKLVLGLTLILAVSKPQGRGPKLHQTEHTHQDFSVTLKHVSFSYNAGYENKVIFDDISVALKSGINIISGPNGVGKTTLLRLINQELTPQSGEITIKSDNHRIFYLRQEPIAVFAKEMPVYENVLQILPGLKHLAVFGVANLMAYIEAQTQRYNLNFDFVQDRSIWFKNAENLSGGQQQKVACLMAHLSDADIILADEPSSGLDERNEQLLKAFFYQLAERGKIIVIISHDHRLHRWQGRHFVLNNSKLECSCDKVSE